MTPGITGGNGQTAYQHHDPSMMLIAPYVLGYPIFALPKSDTGRMSTSGTLFCARPPEIPAAPAFVTPRADGCSFQHTSMVSSCHVGAQDHGRDAHVPGVHAGGLTRRQSDSSTLLLPLA